MADAGAPQVSLELADDLEVALVLLVGRDWIQEVARRREAVAADRAEVGQAQLRAEVLADIDARLDIGQFAAETDAARDQCDLPRLELDHDKFRAQATATPLRTDKHFGSGV